ncbi:MAG: hypothetical protein ON057_001377 [Glomeribacter sp. 1016415]|nr:hypothetical protein [Glomeribacter sp. 1016415]
MYSAPFLGSTYGQFIPPSHHAVLEHSIANLDLFKVNFYPMHGLTLA